MSWKGWKAQLFCVLLSMTLVSSALVPLTSIIGGSTERGLPNTGEGGGPDDRSELQDTGPFYKVIEGLGGDMGFAKAVNRLGDIDGDGTDDLMVIRGGSYGSDTSDDHDSPYGPENYLLMGSSDGNLDGNRMIEFDDLAWTFGVGDLNGDGLADTVSIRYPMKYHPMQWQVDSEPATLEIRYGVSSGLPLTPHATIELMPVAIPMSNWSTLVVKGVGDVNGDGFDDILVICETTEYPQDRFIIGRPAPQEISLYYGSKDGLRPTPGWTRVFGMDERNLWYLRRAILCADLNGDGHSDIVFCFRPWTDLVQPQYYHRIAVHYGSTSGLSIEPDWINSGTLRDEYIPTQVHVGRFDSDDVDDLMILDGVLFGNSDVVITSWRVRIFRGSDDGIGKEPDDTMLFPKDWVGNLVVADMNGDGLDDLVRISIVKNRPFVNFGSRKSVPTRLNVTFKVDINTDGGFEALDSVRYRFTNLPGNEVTTCTKGDLDGDGIDDIVLGITGTKAETEPNQWTIYPGKVLVLFGSGFLDVPVPLQVLDGPRMYSEYKAYHFLVSDSSRGSPLPESVRLTLDPGGEKVTFGWRYREGALDTFTQPDTDSARLESQEEDVTREPDTGSTKVAFKVIFGWSWSHEDPCDAVVEVIDDFGFVRLYTQSGVFSVENDLDFVGELQIFGEVQGRISDGDWVAGGERVHVEGVKVVYEGTESVYPPDGVCNIVMNADDTSYALAPNGPDGSFETSLVMANETDPEVNMTLTARDLPGTAQMVSQRRFTLGVDADPPEFRNAIPEGTDWIGTSTVMVAITVDDTGTSGVDASSLEYSLSINGTKGYVEWTRRNLKTTPDGSIVDGFASLELFDGEDFFIRWRVKDLVGNGYVVSPDIGFRVNTQNIGFSKPVPLGNVWNNASTLQCGVTIRDLKSTLVDVSSVWYRVSHDNVSHYGPWTHWNGMSDNYPIIDPRVDVLFGEGPHNFIQWRAMSVSGTGYITSEHYRVMVDTTPIAFLDFLPTGIQNTSELNVSVLPSDGLLGCGVEWSSLEYRYRTGPDQFSAWHAGEIAIRGGTLELDEEGNQTGHFGYYVAEAHLVGLVEGGENFVQFRGRDEIANGPAISEEYRITVDTSGPEFIRITPRPGEVLRDPLVTMTVSISDNISGVDLTSLSYRFGTDGEGSMGVWGQLSVEMVGDNLQGSVSIALARGRTNVVQFICRDQVGNLNTSDITWVRVNELPIGQIHSPGEGAEYDEGSPLVFDAEGSLDPDGDEMEYEWYIDDGSTPFALGRTARARLPSGSYNVTLLVRDEHGGEDQVSVHFTITSPEVDAPSTLGYLLLILIVAVVFSVVTIWAQRRRRLVGRDIVDDGLA